LVKISSVTLYYLDPSDSLVYELKEMAKLHTEEEL
jgi:hypothetical protein